MKLKLIERLIEMAAIALVSGRSLSFKAPASRCRACYFFRSSSSPREESFRLERILSNRGLGSRRECADLVKAGRVKVDGTVVKSPSLKVQACSELCVNGSPVAEVPLLVAFNKPIGILSTIGDPSGRPSLLEATPASWQKMGLHPVGRLDADTSGLLLFSSDGQLTQRLLHPQGGVEREYIAVVEGDSQRASLAEELAAGVLTSDGTFPAILLEQNGNALRLVVTEGKYRMVRRILANVGLPVLKLTRVRYGAILLNELDLPEGQWCHVSNDATLWARSIMKLPHTLK